MNVPFALIGGLAASLTTGIHFAVVNIGGLITATLLTLTLLPALYRNLEENPES